MENVEAVAWHRKPIWLGVVGLALMVGGWKLMTFVPPAGGEGILAELRRLAPDAEYAERVERFARREPPYKLPGRLAVLAGLLLFVTAGVGMVRTRPPESAEAAREEG